MIIVHLSGQNQQVIPVFQLRENSSCFFMLLLNITFDIPQCTGLRIKVYTTSQLSAHSTHMSNPLHKAMLKLSFRRYSYNDTPQRIHRNKEAGYHHLQISILQQIFRQTSEKRVNNTHLIMQTNDDIGRFMFFSCMQDSCCNI